MQKFRVHSRTAAPLTSPKVDTDQITPSDFLKRISRTGFENGLFAEWRNDPDFIHNLPEYKRFSILFTGDNFGCGFNRERAVWAIQDYGIEVVIVPSFTDSFSGNSGNSGLLVAETDAQFVKQLWTALGANPRTLVTVDLEARIVAFGGRSTPFVVDGHTRYLPLNGLDEIQKILSPGDEIISFEGSRPSWRPVVGQRNPIGICWDRLAGGQCEIHCALLLGRVSFGLREFQGGEVSPRIYPRVSGCDTATNHSFVPAIFPRQIPMVARLPA